MVTMGNLQLSPGSLFANRFEIQRTAGSGGMGTVYRATDRYSSDTVALKLLHVGGGGEDKAERFLREAQLLAELKHPGIVFHVAHGETPDGQRFLAMEWLEGQDLAERLARGPLQMHDCLRLIEQVSEALSVAHQRGIIHRDLKPSNLFLVNGDTERVKILDFGIARRMAASHAMTRTGMVVGTPEYMAPEQARGSRALTPAADLFSIGCVLYECLAGRPPFVADHIAAVLVRILFEEPRPIEDLRPGIATALSQLLTRLLAKDPEQRPADAAALRAALSTLGELPEPSLGATLDEPTGRADRFAQQEQHLFCIVLAAPPVEDLRLSPTLPGDAVQFGSPQRQALLDALAGLSGTSDFLADGTLVVTVPPLGSAQDQATVAARAALLIKERWTEAVVSMATGRGIVRGRTAVGEVVEQAARAMRSSSQAAGTARADQTSGVRIDALSAKLLEGRFAQTPQPEGALLLYEERDADASRPLLGKPTPCVGREAELGTLESQLTACIEESEARVVLFTAPPGAGKSRLRHEFLRRAERRSEPVTLLLGRGDVMSAGAPYGILRDAIHKLCGLSGGEPLETRRQRLRERVARHLAVADADRIVQFVAELCNVPLPEEGRPMLKAARQDPKILQDWVRRALLDFFAAECAAAPVLLVLDDLQWGDELSVSFLDEALGRQQGSPLFVLGFARPEVHQTFPKLWHGHKVQELALKGLSKKACERLIVQVLGKEMTPDVVAHAIEQSAGNALFLEELIRSLAEGHRVAQPETVVAMLQARIGRLDGNLRRLVRAAAIFGQSFWLGSVAVLLGQTETTHELEGGLVALVDAELIQASEQSRLPNQREYRFRHSLVRDAAYGLLTEEDLRAGHRLAAAFLASAGERDPSVFGEHYEKGGELPRAALAFAKAAELAMGYAGLEPTLRYVERGLRCGPTGETLGTLRSIEGQVALWRSEIERAFTAAVEVLSLLRPGSGGHCRALATICLAAIYGSPRALPMLPEMLQLVLSIEPEPEGLPLLIEAVSDLLGPIGATSPWPQVQVVVNRLEQLVAQNAERDPLSERWLCMGRCHAVHHHLPTPWGVLLDARRGLSLAEQAGDCRTLVKLELIGRDMPLGELGDPEVPARIREVLKGDLVRTEVLIRIVNMAWLALLLCQGDAPAELDEALHWAEEATAAGPENQFCQGLGHLIRAQVQVQKKEDAESEARSATSILASIALWLPAAQATLMRALILNGKAAAAVEVAEQGLALLEQFGRVGFLEVELRLAIAEAFRAAGDERRSRAELGETLRQIQLRSDDITDPFWKNSYLTRNVYCARAQQLAREWGLDVVIT